MRSLSLFTATLLVLSTLAACDSADSDAPTLRFASALAVGPEVVIEGDTVRFAPATYDSLLADGADLPPFPFSVTPSGVRIDGYYVALTGARVETQIERRGDAVVIEIGLADGGNGTDQIDPSVYVAEITLGDADVRRVQIVHEGDLLTDTRGEPVVVFDQAVSLSR